MGNQSFDVNEVKRRVRKLKHVEYKIRFQGDTKADAHLVWDALFDLKVPPSGKARYALLELAAMSRDEYKRVVDEFFALVYFEFYKANGFVFAKTYDPAVLAQLDLPFNATESDVKKRFRELAKKYHPDTGGDAQKFIEFMKVYEKLAGK